jgi:hypothetical protein
VLFYLRDKIFRASKTRFNQAELSLILGVYSDHVKRGVWRDYAIDSLDDMAVFSVFRSSKESPSFRITKVASRKISDPAEYIVYDGGMQPLKSSRRLSDVLELFQNENS